MDVLAHCPTCGMAVKVVSGDEGTSHYEPAPPYPHSLLSGGRWYVPADDHRGAVEDRDQALETLGLLGWLYREATGHAPNPDDYMRARAAAGGQ